MNLGWKSVSKLGLTQYNLLASVYVLLTSGGGCWATQMLSDNNPLDMMTFWWISEVLQLMKILICSTWQEAVSSSRSWVICPWYFVTAAVFCSGHGICDVIMVICHAKCNQCICCLRWFFLLWTPPKTKTNTKNDQPINKQTNKKPQTQTTRKPEQKTPK